MLREQEEAIARKSSERDKVTQRTFKKSIAGKGCSRAEASSAFARSTVFFQATCVCPDHRVTNTLLMYPQALDDLHRLQGDLEAAQAEVAEVRISAVAEVGWHSVGGDIVQC